MATGRERRTGRDRPAVAGFRWRVRAGRGARYRRPLPRADSLSPKPQLRGLLGVWYGRSQRTRRAPRRARFDPARRLWYSLAPKSPGGEYFRRDARVVPRQPLVAHGHALFVALACKQHRVAWRGSRKQQLDGRPTIQLDRVVGPLRTRSNLPRNFDRVLVVGIVRGDSEEVGLVRREPAHDWTIGEVAATG